MAAARQFPEGFHLGAATAAFQIEGAAAEDGKRDSIWDVFCREPGRVANGDDGTLACDHYHRMPSDVQLMADLGLTTYRFSISWPRVLDGDRVNEPGMDFYSRLVDELLARDITPWLTLYHWDLPASIEGGWTNRDTAQRFVDYARTVHARLADRVRIWTTLNEPWCSSFLSYAAGVHAPGTTDATAAVRAAHHLLLGHGWAVQALREADPTATLGISLNLTPVMPASDDPADVDVARRIDGTLNRYFADPIFKGRYPADVVADLGEHFPDDLVADGDLEAISSPIDVLGVNYYTTNVFRAGDPSDAPTPHVTAPNAVQVLRDLPTTAMGWEVDPAGLTRLLTRFHQDYTADSGTGLVVTENGAAYDESPDETGYVDDTATRLDYLRRHLAAVHDALTAGVDVRGYLVWSLIDNFEWSFGYSKKFGVVAMDADLNRVPKASAHWYSGVARTGVVPAEPVAGETLTGDSPASRVSLPAKVALTGGLDFWHTQAVDEAELPSVMITDGPHGLRKQAGAAADIVGINESVPATCFPPAVGLASTWDPDLLTEVGEALGTECLVERVGVLLGPGLNIKRSPLCGRNFEYFSEDPLVSGVLASALVRGVQNKGVGTSVKHFAANNQETDRMRRDSVVDERTLREIYLRGFHRVVTEAHPWTVMCSYNRINGTFASENRWLLTDILRGEWGFEGLVVSDWGAVHDRVASLQAGLDLEMPANPEHEAGVTAALAEGRIGEATIDTAYTRIERVLRRAVASFERAPDSFDVDAHHALARRAAEESIVLLANDGLLPLAPGARVAVVGEFARTPRYQGAGSSRVNPTRLDNALDAINALVGHEVPFAPGFTTAPGQELPETAVEDAVAVARDAEVVLAFLGLGEAHESEGYDRDTLLLPAEQLAVLDAILEVNPNVVVVLSNGSSLQVSGFADRVRAIVEVWLGGQAGGPAAADVLFGVANPSGKLTETIPVRLEDVPSFTHFPGDDNGVIYGEGLFVGYRGYDARGLEVSFPFGHGLSYTTFEYSELSVETGPDGLSVGVTVTNTGERAGREIVQAYVAVDASSVARVPRELKGFTSVRLEPGEASRVEIAIARDDLAYWSVRDHAWVVESGSYTVSVGASSRDLRLGASVDVAGNEPVRPLTMMSTLGEALAVPAFAEQLGPVVEQAFGGDEEMLKMLASIPLSTFAGFSGRTQADLQSVLDEVNVASTAG
jgi:beta-glucosidase